MADVEVLIRNIVEGEEDVEQLDTTFGKLSESTQKWGAEYERANKSLEDFMNRFDAARKVTDDMDKILAHAEGTIDLFAESTTEATKTTTKATKATSGWRKQLTGAAKGLLGIATAYAGGRWLIGIAKDSIKAARAAGVGEAAFTRWESATDRLKVAIGTGLIASFERNEESMTGMTNRLATTAEAWAALNQAIADGEISLFSASTATIASVLPFVTLTDQVDKLGFEFDNLNFRGDELSDFNQQMRIFGNNVQKVTGDTGTLITFFEDLDAATQDLANDAIAKLRQQMEPLGQDFEDVQESIEDLRKEQKKLNEELGQPFITAKQKETAQERLGEIEEEINNVTAAWDLQTKQLLFNLAEQQLALGGFTAAELAALRQLAGPDGLGLIDETSVAVLETIEKLSQQDLTTFQKGMGLVAGELSNAEQSSGQLLEDIKNIGTASAAEIAIDSSKILTGIERSDLLLEKLDMINGKTVSTNVIVNIVPGRIGGEFEDPDVEDFD